MGGAIMLRKILTGFLGLIVVTIAATWFFWPRTWTVNAPMMNSLFGWGIEATPEARLRQTLKLPDGYDLNIYATGLGQARILRWTSAGDLLVSVPRKGTVLLIEADKDKSGRGGAIQTLLSGLNKPHGLEIVDGYLLVGETDSVIRVPFDEARGETTGPIERIIRGIPGDGNHWSRTLRRGPDGWIYMQIGSSCNACIEQGRAVMMRFKPDGSNLETYAQGLRNTVGWDWDPKTGAMWGVDNGRDLLGDNFPPCELNKIEQGRFYGWPFLNGSNVPDPDFGNTPDPRIASATPPAFGFPAHVAPLSLKFMGPEAPPGLENTALVTFHGSWNRTRKQGYEVMALHWNDKGDITMTPFLTGFVVNEEARGRPVDTSVGPDGAIYVSDDYAGAIYRISYNAPAVAKVAPAMPAPLAVGEPSPEAVPADSGAVARGAALYTRTGCKSCHFSANGLPMVKLANLSSRYNDKDIAALLTTPPANMPAFPLTDDQKRDLAAYLLATYK